MKIGEKLQELGFVGVMEMRAGALEMEFIEMVELIDFLGGQEIVFDDNVTFFVKANTVF